MLTASLRMPVLRLTPFERQHWPTTLVLATMLGLYLLAGLSVAGLGGPDGRALAREPRDLAGAVRIAEAPPRPEPLAFRAIAPQDAVAINAAVPISTAPNPAARAFLVSAATPDDRTRSLECLTAAVYYEAATEPIEGQRAVAQVVLNRVRHPAYPNSVCGVVFEGSQRATGCQFTFTCDGALRRTPSVAGWKRARDVAEAALAGKVYAPVGYATHYHTNWVVPYWSASLVKAAVVGTHIFYRWADGWGRPAAFTSRYAGTEPAIGLMRPLTAVPATLAGADDLAVPVAGGEESADAGSIDSFQRAVLRRYEPATRQGVASVVAAQTRAGEAVTPSYRWALTGEGEGPKQAPLGKTAQAAPAKPVCVEAPAVAAPAPGAAVPKPVTC